MRRAISAAQAALLIPDGASFMFGGFMGVGTPERIIDALVARNARDLTIIGNDTARPGVGVGELFDAGCVARAIVSHIGTNPLTQKKMIAGEMVVDLIQGTLAERIRAGGAGLGGVLTPTGVGTMVAEGKQVITVGETDYLLELPLRADFAAAEHECIKAHQHRCQATKFAADPEYEIVDRLPRVRIVGRFQLAHVAADAG
jgi:acetate CoA/acetoacetate CoA-transferase alpha subunit